MELTTELVDKIVTGNFAKATFDFQQVLKDKYSKIKETFKKEFKHNE